MTDFSFFEDERGGSHRSLQRGVHKGRCGQLLPMDLRHFPDVPQCTRRAKAKFIGAAGEYLVDSVLTRAGLTVWTAADLDIADRLLNIAGTAVLIQVKTVTAPRHGRCTFQNTHGNARAGGVFAYGEKDFHIAALAVLSHNVVKFVPNLGRSFSVLESELEDLAADPIDSLEVAIAHIVKARRLPQC
ncbi:hypothetical protein [Tabrizicola sp. M-4]|uniref:hypothetical protein n=1 Tax=Tabrizicola sp. M-4 TaxID=3055847 RepID=UPI003DA95748